MRVLGIIPARGGSKRVPRKNVRLLGGKPLVAWSIEACLGAKRLAQTIVSTDDPEVLEIARSYDPKLALPRPAELATDTSTAIEFVHHALNSLESQGAARFDAVAIVQPSSPFTQSADIDAVLQLLESSGSESCVTIMEVDHAVHPFKLKVLDGDRLLPYMEEERGRMASHHLPKVYVRNGSVYASRRNVHDAGKILSDDCRCVLMPRERSIDINDELDWAFTQFLVSRETEVAAR